jgi:Flp pilus assembly protein TadG
MFLRKHLQDRRGRRGNALIEMAIATTILLPLFYGTFQFGLAFFYYNELANAVRAGARYGAYRTYNSPTSTPSAAYVTAVQNMVVYGSPNGGTKPVVPGLTTDNVSITVAWPSNRPQSVRVAISNFSMNTIISRFQLNKPVSTFPFIGRFAPE